MHSHTRTLRPKLMGTALVLCLVFNANLSHSPLNEPQVLARVELTASLAKFPLPVYAHLQGTDGSNYVIVRASLNQLDQAKCHYQVLDANPADSHYIIGLQRGEGQRSEFGDIARVVHDDGNNLIFQADQEQADALAAAGLDTEWLSTTPISTAAPKYNVLQRPVVEYNADIANIINSVTEAKTRDLLNKISGETPVTVGGASYTIKTRNTNSGQSIEKATQFAHEFMSSKGLKASFHKWSQGRNVIGEKTGGKRANEIVVVCAHYDDLPASGSAPGADDNGSGSVGVMLAAEAIAGQTFDRTIRCCLFTGEEQQLLGSAAYASACKSAGDKIVGVVNLDMIGTDTRNAYGLSVGTRGKYNEGSYSDTSIANTFKDVLKKYNINVKVSVNSSGGGQSDHASFWKNGYSAIMCIESDFSKHYHKASDKVSTLSIPFATNVIKGAVGTVAQLAGAKGVYTYEGTNADASAPKATQAKLTVAAR